MPPGSYAGTCGPATQVFFSSYSVIVFPLPAGVVVYLFTLTKHARGNHYLRSTYLDFMRLFLTFFVLLSVLPLAAEDLTVRLRQLLPGEEPATVNERQFLHQRVRGMYLELETAKISGKSTKKQLARIQTFLQRSYLKTYAPGAELADAFRKGSYNDATAAVLTALALEYFDIEYYALVDHWEAYLLADPSDRQERIRHPASRKRKQGQERTYRANFIDLVRATIAPDLEVRGSTQIEEAFYEYYYQPRKLLSFGQLAAYALFQEGSAAYRAGAYEKAISFAERAAQRENRPVFLMLRRAAELQLAATRQPEETGDIQVFFDSWVEDPDNKYFPAAILNHFDQQQQVLLATNRPDLAKDLLNNYAARAPAGSAPWEQELIRLQRFRLVDHYHKHNQLTLARQEAEALLANDAENETVRYLLGELVIGELRRKRATGDAFAALVQQAAAQYPFIRKQDRFADLLLRELAWKVRDLYAVDKVSDAGKALARFRAALADITIGRKRSLWTLTAFYAASDYYFRQGDYGSARKFTEEALQYSPEDHFLLHRRDLLSRY